jgi:hypothetical protein
MTPARASFDLAARRVAQRFRRRWPNAAQHIATVDDIKWRWYRNNVTHIKRGTLGKP